MRLLRYSHSDRRPLPGRDSRLTRERVLSVEERRPPQRVIPNNQQTLRGVAPIVILPTKALIVHFVE